MAEWQPIETAPRDGTPVDLWVVTSKDWRPNGEEWREVDCIWQDGCWMSWEDRMDDYGPVESVHHTATHWRRVSPPA